MVQPRLHQGPRRHTALSRTTRLSRATARSTGAPGLPMPSSTRTLPLAELMGSWQIGFFTSVAPGWVKSGQLGIGAFPTVPGGKGNPTDLEGNTTTYVGLASHITAAQTYVAERSPSTPGHPRVRDGADRPRYRAFAEGLADGVQLSASFEAVPGHDLTALSRRRRTSSTPGTRLWARPRLNRCSTTSPRCSSCS